VREYETTLIVQPEISDEGLQAICERLDGILDKRGAIRLFYDDMGRRRLAYEVRSFQKGQYLTLFYLDEGKVVPEIERALRLDDAVLRFLTVLANEDVRDVEARKAEAVEIERVRAERAAERAAREAKDAERVAEAAAREAEEMALANELLGAPDEEDAESFGMGDAEGFDVEDAEGFDVEDAEGFVPEVDAEGDSEEEGGSDR
jgi:small subunit ribosomal protein S6